MSKVGWLALVALTAVLLYLPIASGWWYVDDPELIAYAVSHPAIDIVTMPDIYQQFSPFNLTPWIILSLKIDARMSGFSPRFFYLHQIVALAFVTCLLYVFLSFYIRRSSIAFAVVLLFLLQPATLAVTEWLSTRHYLEGFGFTLLSAIGFILGVRRRKNSWLFLSTIFYLLAALTKEVYVPLPLMLVLLPEGTFRDRIKRIVPLLAAAAFYGVYRTWMLGNNSFGGYTTIWPWTVPSALRDSYKLLYAYAYSWLPPVTIGIMVIRVLSLSQRSSDIALTLARWAAAFLLLYLPIVPVSPLWGGNLSLRYFFLTSTFVSIALAFMAERLHEQNSLTSRAIASAAVVVTLVFMGSAFFSQRALWQQEKERAHIEANFFLANRQRDIVFKAGQPHWYFDGLEKMGGIDGTVMGHRKINLAVMSFFNFERGTAFAAGSAPVFAYDAASRRVLDVTAASESEHRAFLHQIKEEPLTVQLVVDRGVMKLDLGPYEGRYTLLESLPDHPDYCYLAVDIHRKFGIKLTHRGRIRIFRFAYTSPDGWVTVSPGFLVDRTKDQTVTWQRP